MRELEHLVHRSFLLAKDDIVRLDLPAGSDEATDIDPCGAVTGQECRSRSCFAAAKALAIAEFERAYVSETLVRAKGNLSLAARLAGKERSRFGRLVKKHGLRRTMFADTSLKIG